MTTLQERLREHRVILKSGEYDGAQLMAAWCDMVNAADALDAQEARIKALEGALEAVDDLIQYQYSGTREAMTYLTQTCDLARALLGEK